MAVRAVNSCYIFRSTASFPSLPSTFRCRVHQFQSLRCSDRRKYSKLGFRFTKGLTTPDFNGCFHESVRLFSIHSLVHSVMEELEAIRRTKRVRAGNENKQR